MTNTSNRIYVTAYRRTQNTGDSLRTQLGIDMAHYLSDTSCTDLLNKIKASNDGKNAILIIRHSNTLSTIILNSGITDYPSEEISGNEFDNLFLIQFKK